METDTLRGVKMTTIEELENDVAVAESNYLDLVQNQVPAALEALNAAQVALQAQRHADWLAEQE